MKKFFIVMLLAFFCVAPPSVAIAADCQTEVIPLNVVNSTGKTVAAIYIAKTSTSEWSENLIPAEIIRSGETAAVPLPLERGGVFYLWDMKIIDAGFAETVIERLPLTDIYDLELLPNAESRYYVIKAGT